MAVGDLIVVNNQIELRATLMGDRAPKVIGDGDRGGLSGLVDVATALVETEYAHEDGSFVGSARVPARTATAALLVTGDTPTDCGDNLEAQRAVWAASSTALPLYFQLAGFGKRYVLGHPLGFVALDVSSGLEDCAVPILASFRITDPTIYT